MRKKALVVSFFKSNNLGDLSLSNALSDLVYKKEFEIIKYDFLEIEKIHNSQTEIFITPKPKRRYIDNYPKIKNLLLRAKFQLKNFINNEKWNRFERDIKKCDVVIIGGGNMLMDTTIIWPMIFKKYIDIAAKNNKNIFVLNIGAGPILHNVSRKYIGQALDKVKFISVRDNLSKNTLLDINQAVNITESVDLVFSYDWNNLDKRLKKNDSFDKGSIVIGVCVLGEVCFKSQKDHSIYLENVEKLLLNLSKKTIIKFEFILFSTETLDYPAVEILHENLKLKEIDVKIKTINYEKEITDFYKGLDFLIGGRMHSVIFSQKLLVPYISLIWQDKIIGLAKVTDNMDKAYQIYDLNNNRDEIFENINNSINNKILIKKMNNKNNELYELFNKIKIE